MRIQIIVGIQMADDIAAGKRKCPAKCNGLAGILLIDITDFWKVFHHLGSAVRLAIVEDDDFVRRARLIQDAREALRQIPGIIVSADQNRHPLAHRSSSGQLTNVLQIPPPSSHRLTHLLTRRCTRAGAPAQAKSMAERERSLQYPIPE